MYILFTKYANCHNVLNPKKVSHTNLLFKRKKINRLINPCLSNNSIFNNFCNDILTRREKKMGIYIIKTP